MQIAGHGIGVLHLVEGLNGTFVVLVQKLCKGGAVAGRLAEAGLSLCEVTLGDVQVAESLTEAVGTNGIGDVLLCLSNLAVAQSDESEVCISLRSVLVHAQCLLDVLVGLLLVALVEGEHGEVVQGAIVAVPILSGLLIDGLLLSDVVGEGGGIEHLLDAELRSVVGILFTDLVVAAAYDIVVDGQAGTAQLGKNAVGKLTEGLAHVTNLLLALLGIFIHGEHAKDDVLVLDVAGLHKLLEALPVLGGVVCVDIGLHIGLLQRLLHVVLRHILTLAGEAVVVLETTLRRCEGLNLDILDGELLTTVGTDLLEQAYELLHGVVLQLALTEHGLVDEELHAGIVLLRLDALEGVGGNAATGLHHGLLVELARGDDTRSDLHSRYGDLLLTDASLEGEVHVALLHLRHIGEGSLHGVVTTEAIGDGLVVAKNLLALEGGGQSLCHLAVAIAQLGDDGDDGLPLHILFRELTIDGCGHIATHGLKRIGGNLKIVSRQRAEFRTRSKNENDCCNGSKNKIFAHEYNLFYSEFRISISSFKFRVSGFKFVTLLP